MAKTKKRGKIRLGMIRCDTHGYYFGLFMQKFVPDRLAYIIHGIALSMNVFGKDVQWVEAMGSLPLEYLHLHMRSGRDVMLMNPGVDVFPERCSFYVEAYSKMGAIHSPPIGDFVFPKGAAANMRLAKKTAQTGKPPIAYDDMLENIAVATAARKAREMGRAVQLKEVWKR
jgi:hypothetical protein